MRFSHHSDHISVCVCVCIEERLKSLRSNQETYFFIHSSDTSCIFLASFASLDTLVLYYFYPIIFVQPSAVRFR